MRNKKPKILVIVGPTATGKSDLAIALARRFDGEVISADSRQVFRGMDIGTGKVTEREMRSVPHHLLSVASPRRTFTVAQYKKHAKVAIQDIIARNKIPILCGGTGFYIQALVDDLSIPEVKPDPQLRKKLSQLNANALYQMLKKIDAKRARTIDAKNPYRLIRAIEIAKKLGKVPLLKKRSPYTPLFVGIEAPDELLRERIHIRLAQRMKAGMLNEVKRLHGEGLSWKRMEALGLEYRYLARYLEKKITKQEMLTQLEHEIVHYAKRQYTWFRKDKRVLWIRMGDTQSAEKIASMFLSNS